MSGTWSGWFTIALCFAILAHLSDGREEMMWYGLAVAYAAISVVEMFWPDKRGPDDR